MSRPWLAEDIPLPERLRLVDIDVKGRGWKFVHWPRFTPKFLRKLSQTWPVLRLVVLADHVQEPSPEQLYVKVHEREHVVSVEETGHLRWLWRYGAALAMMYTGVVGSVAACLVTPLVSSAFWWLALPSWALLGAAMLLWKAGQAFRYQEEPPAFGAGVAASIAYSGADHTEKQADNRFNADRLCGNQYPYWTRGEREHVMHNVTTFALQMLEDESAEEAGAE